MEGKFSVPWRNRSPGTNESPSNGSQGSFDGEICYKEELRLGFYTQTDDYVVKTVYLTIAVLGVLINPLAICVITVGKNIGYKIKLQLINLAVADFFTALVYPVATMLWLLELEFPPNLSLCRFIHFLGIWSFTASILWTLIISVERFVVVYFPLKSRNYRRVHKIAVAIVIWALGLLPRIPTVTTLDFDEDIGYYLCEDYMTPEFALWIIQGLIFGALLITLTMYLLIGIKVHRGKMIGESTGLDRAAKQHHNRKMKVVKMLAVDSVITAVVWLPSTIYWLFIDLSTEEFDLGCRGDFIAQIITLGLFNSNCFKTPLIYYIVNESFREDTHALFWRICGRQVELQVTSRSSDETSLSPAAVADTINTSSVTASSSTKTGSLTVTSGAEPEISYM